MKQYTSVDRLNSYTIGYCWKCGFPLVDSWKTTCGDIACVGRLSKRVKNGETYYIATCDNWGQYIEKTEEEAKEKAIAYQRFVKLSNRRADKL